MTHPMIDELLALEGSVWNALVIGDSEADEAMLTSDFLGVYPTGFATRADHTANASVPCFSSYEICDPRVIEVTPDALLLSYRSQYLRCDGDVDEEVMFITSLWVRTDDGWKNSFSQDTPAAGPAE